MYVVPSFVGTFLLCCCCAACGAAQAPTQRPAATRATAPPAAAAAPSAAPATAATGTAAAKAASAIAKKAKAAPTAPKVCRQQQIFLSRHDANGSLGCFHVVVPLLRLCSDATMAGRGSIISAPKVTQVRHMSG